jgi:cytochrome P450
MKTIKDIAVLSGETWSGHAAEFRRTKAEIFLRAMRELGDIGLIRFFNVPIVVLSAPHLVHEALVERQKSFVKSLATRIMFYPFAGKGLFTSEGEHWRRQRKLLSPLFHPGAIKSYAPAMNAVIERCLDDWRDGDIIDAGREMTRITMAIAGKVMFDADTLDESDELSDSVRALFEWLSEMSGSASIVATVTAASFLIELGNLPKALDRARTAAVDALHEPFPFPTKFRKRFFSAIRKLDDRIQRMIDDRRRAGHAREDLLSRLLTARDEDDGSFMTDRQVRDEALTLFVAGHETTATSTTWALYFLSRNPDAYRRWKEETARLSGKTATAEEALRLEWTRGVFREAMRICPPAFAVDRVAVEDVEVGGYRLPRKTAIIIPTHALHRHEASFPDPDRFDPGRFSAEAEAKRPRGAYIPFGMGPRICIGAQFAELEAELLLARIAQRFDFEPVNTEPIGPDFTTALRPEKPVLLRVKRAAPAATNTN